MTEERQAQIVDLLTEIRDQLDRPATLPRTERLFEWANEFVRRKGLVVRRPGELEDREPEISCGVHRFKISELLIEFAREVYCR